MARNVDFDWYLTDWMASLDVSQADLCRETGYPKSKMSDLVNGGQRYNRDIVNEVSRALKIRPYELLMHPDLAKAFQRQREDSLRIVADTETLATGTGGR